MGWEENALWRIEVRIMRLAHDVRRIIRLEEDQMAVVDDILDRVRRQKSLLDGLKTFIDGLKGVNDPVKLAAIVAELDANNVAIDVMDNVEPPPVP